MNAEMVAPSQLHRDIERAAHAGDERKDILTATLQSGNLAVIRRIPFYLSPLSAEEKEMVAVWAEGLTQHEDVTKRDFAFHLMANCRISGERILIILGRNKTFSQSVLEHIEKVLGGSDMVLQLEQYLAEVAEKLLTEERIPSRDRGRHMLMTLARTDDQWEELALRFSSHEISDLRQRVIERFLAECPNGPALTRFCTNVVAMCLECIHNAPTEKVHEEAPHMHWVLTCLQRVEDNAGLSQAASLLKSKFGTTLPRSVRYRIQALSPPKLVHVARLEPPPSIERRYDWATPVDDLPKAPVRPASSRPAAQATPRSIEAALQNGWTIHQESGRQVVLLKDGKSVTFYRPKVSKVH